MKKEVTISEHYALHERNPCGRQGKSKHTTQSTWRLDVAVRGKYFPNMDRESLTCRFLPISQAETSTRRPKATHIVDRSIGGSFNWSLDTVHVISSVGIGWTFMQAIPQTNPQNQLLAMNYCTICLSADT